MAKITTTDLKSLGFPREMFSSLAADDVTFDELLTSVIAEQALQLSGRIGTTLYNDATSPNADYVKLAEKYLSAAELLQRKINIILGNTASRGEDFSTTPERKQRQDYLDMVNGNDKASPPVVGLIEKLAQGVTTDPSANFASGALITDHFGTTT